MNKVSSKQNVKRFLIILLLVLLLTLLSAVVFADVESSVSGAVSNVRGLFNFDADNPGFLDFLIFFVIFMSLSWLGFSRWFQQGGGGGKPAIIGLSVGISVAFAASLVYAANFGIGKLLPFAVVFLGLALFILLYALMSKILKADSVGKKILALIIALVLTILIVSVGMSYLVGEGVCDRNSVLQKICGSDSIFARLGDRLGGISEPSREPSANRTAPTRPIESRPAERPEASARGIPPRIQQQITEITRQVNATEARVNRAITDRDLEELERVIETLQHLKSQVQNIISNLAAIE